MKRSKAASKAKAHAQKMRDQEQEKLERNMARLKTMTSGFARTERPKDFKAQTSKTMRRQSDLELLPVGGRYTPADNGQQKPVLSPEMKLRDDAARAEIQAKMLRVGPLGNKMGYQFMTDSDLSDFQKGLLRRR